MFERSEGRQTNRFSACTGCFSANQAKRHCTIKIFMKRRRKVRKPHLNMAARAVPSSSRGSAPATCADVAIAKLHEGGISVCFASKIPYNCYRTMLM